MRQQAERAAMRAMSEQDRDPYSPTRGCFDRRHWAWKLVDFPDATLQRLVYPLALLYRDPDSALYQRDEARSAVVEGIRFAMQIQHRNGSFDQAFPFEQSWGATAFLLHPLLEARRLVAPALDGDAARVDDRLAAAASFLCRERERHGQITNHLAGGALSLYTAAIAMKSAELRSEADRLLAEILESQSQEGWFPEYGGADPGYQSLCLHYLAEISSVAPSPALTTALDRAIEFLQWFVHPDGTLGGTYGSRRTRLAHIGGFARLAARSPIATAILEVLAGAIAAGRTVSVDSVDGGNLAPLFTNLLCALRQPLASPGHCLPAFQPGASRDFAAAGLYVRSSARYHAIVGASNGGTLTVFDRASKTLSCDDGGYVGELSDGLLVTSQARARAPEISGNQLTVRVSFCRMPWERPTPALFLVLRILNLTVMRSIAIGNIVKRAMARRLLEGRGTVDLHLQRRMTFSEEIDVHDRVESPSGLQLRWLRGGQSFKSIHMASAGYFEPIALQSTARPAVNLDVAQLSRDRFVKHNVQLP